MEALVKDIRIAVRGLVRRPVFTTVAVVSLALGVGANGAVFSLINGLLFRPLPGVEEGDRLVRIYDQTKSFDFPLGLSYPNFVDLREALAAQVSGFAGQVPSGFGIAVGGEPARAGFAVTVVGGYFETLGTEAARGRLFTAAEVAARAPVVVVSHEFWQARLGGDPAAIGRPLELNGRPFDVVGVAPEGFSGTEVLFVPELWVPLPAVDEMVGPGILEERGSKALRVTARLRDGVAPESFAATLETVSANLVAAHPDANRGSEFRVMPESDARIEAGLGKVSRIFAAILMTLVGGVLLIACANVANLLLARADARQKETGVRVAIGATRGQLLRHHLVESLVLAAAGGVVGTGLAFATARLIAAYRPPGSIPVRLAPPDPDLRVLLFSALVALAAGLISGLAPALGAMRRDPMTAIRTVAGSAGGRKVRLGSALVVVQVALSLVLLVAAGLFLRSLRGATDVDLGFDATGVGAITFDVATARLDEERGRAFLDEVERSVAALPGVDRVALAYAPPMDWTASGVSLGVGRDLGDELGDELLVLASWVGPGYFELMATPIVAGRAFAATDDPEHPQVVIVNQALAERVWPGESAVGRTLRIGGREGEAAEVVGVVPTGKYRLPAEAPRPYAFLPLEQRYRERVTVLLESRRPLAGVIEDARRQILALQPDLAIDDARPYLETVESRMLGPIALVASLAGSFGFLGLVLAAVGLYGVMALQVAQRTREIGIRMALGADARQVLRGVLTRGLRLTAVGVVAGALVSLAATRVLQTFLVGVSARDPLTFVGVVLLLVAVAALASLVPALRAARVDPVRTLKAE